MSGGIIDKILPKTMFVNDMLRHVEIFLSNGHSPQIRKTRSLLMRMCRGESHFSQKWPLANVGESGESEQNRLANVGESGKSVQHGLVNVGESGESEQNDLSNVGESGEYLPSLFMNVGSSNIGRFMHK
jgi:hypothetical protein